MALVLYWCPQDKTSKSNRSFLLVLFNILICMVESTQKDIIPGIVKTQKNSWSMPQRACNRERQNRHRGHFYTCPGSEVGQGALIRVALWQ